MRSCVDSIKVVFPFEVEIYRNAGMDVEFVGHPLVERIGSSLSRTEFRERHGMVPEKKLLALLPGSRPQEISTIFPTMIQAAERLRTALDLEVAVGVAPNLGAEFLRPYVPQDSGFHWIEHGTYDLMAHADAAIVTSGTATLETGWFGTPMAVVYRTSTITFFIGRMLVNVPHIGLVNIVAGKRVVPEFIQGEMTAANLERAVGRMLRDPSYANDLRRELAVIRTKLGGPGASARVAEGILRLAEAA
jgi:lipid-A-disaccharide synthase